MPSAPCILADLIKHLTEYRHSRKTDLISVENLLSTVNGIPSVLPAHPSGWERIRVVVSFAVWQSIMAVPVLSWAGRHVGFLARKDAILARNSNLIWMQICDLDVKFVQNFLILILLMGFLN